jgi:NAD(P) transhydrogenase
VILIACGSRPYHPPQFGFDGNGIYDPNTFMRANYMPKNLAVVGAGPTGCEYAMMFASRSASHVITERHDELMRVSAPHAHCRPTAPC